jgi:hypothetical protein
MIKTRKREMKETSPGLLKFFRATSLEFFSKSNNFVVTKNTRKNNERMEEKTEEGSEDPYEKYTFRL